MAILLPRQLPQPVSKRKQEAVEEAAAIIAALPDEVIVQYMDDMDDDIWSTSSQVARFFHDTLTPPPWYVDSSSRHSWTGQPYYGPGDDDLYEISNLLAWLNDKGISKPAVLLINEFNFFL
jgi:hypothetical protein